MVTIDHSGVVLYAKANPESLVPREFQKKRWGLKEWEYFKDKTIEVRKYPNEQNSKDEVGVKA